MTKLTGQVLHPGDPGWDEARHGFAARFDYDSNVPKVIVFCQTTQDAVNAVKWATETATPIRARCGRHNYQGYSSLVRDGIIIDVSDLDTVSVDMDSLTAVVGAGSDMLSLTERLWDSGVTMPLATGPSVGIAGLTLGGGFGITSRLLSMTCDNLVAAEVVNAEGHVLHVNEHDHANLFWALKGGGGGNFGVVTSFTFNIHPISLVAAFNWTWDWSQFVNVVDTWQKWAPDNPENGLTSILTLTADLTITMSGQYTTEPQTLPQIYKLLEPMLATGPISTDTQIVPHVNAARMFFGVDPLNPTWRIRAHADNQIFKSSSAFSFAPFSTEIIQQMKDRIEKAPILSAPPSQPTMIQLLGCGGVASQVPPEATAVWARHAKFIVQYDGYWTAPQDEAATIAWVEDFRNAMKPVAWGAYANYSDELIPEPMEEYYGPNLARLIKVKKEYDPNNVFNFPQSIPV